MSEHEESLDALINCEDVHLATKTEIQSALVAFSEDIERFGAYQMGFQLGIAIALRNRDMASRIEMDMFQHQPEPYTREMLHEVEEYNRLWREEQAKWN